MSEKFKSKIEVDTLAFALKERRRRLGLTLKDVESSIGVNCGQLSRFEAGRFKSNSNNLQKLCSFMQMDVTTISLGERLEKVAARSPSHRAAVEEILAALERLS